MYPSKPPNSYASSGVVASSHVFFGSVIASPSSSSSTSTSGSPSPTEPSPESSPAKARSSSSSSAIFFGGGGAPRSGASPCSFSPANTAFWWATSDNFFRCSGPCSFARTMSLSVTGFASVPIVSWSRIENPALALAAPRNALKASPLGSALCASS